MDTMDRVWLMLTMIPRAPRKIDGATLEAQLVARGYEVSRRTIQRDLERLSGLFPLRCDDRSKPFGWSWQEEADGFSVPGMDPAAALSMRLIDLHLSTLLPPTVRRTMQPYIAAAGKVLERLVDNPLCSWPEKVRVVPSGQPLRPAEIDPQVLEVVCEGLLRERRFRCSYRSRGTDEIKEYEVSPLGLVSKERLLYLVATLWDYNDPVLLLPHRMTSAILLETVVKPPAGFNLDAYLARGELQFAKSNNKLRLDVLFSRKAGSHLLETPLSEDQVVSETKDGRLRIKATVLDTRQLRWWLLGFGQEVEALGPKGLRGEFSEMAAELAGIYGRQGLPFAVEVPDVALERWQRDEINQGLEEMRSGRVVDHAEVVKHWSARK